ncbi:MAG TPA: hypothetical protein VHG69_02860 [Thermoleophilaceae bacterium]|nr:hypothetical protein [Thermoleophilaceae bacterium]
MEVISGKATLSKRDARLLPLPAEAIDVAEWLFGLTDDEYRSFAKAHLGGGRFQTSDDRRGFFDAEGFLFAFIVNHHREEEARSDYVRVRSSDSRAWLARWIPVPLEVVWEMEVRPRAEQECELECRLQIGLPARALKPLAVLLGVPIAQRRHMTEQMTGFAADVVAKYGPSGDAQ